METIFDHNPTDEELNRWGGREAFELLKQHGVDIFESPNNANYCLGILFSGRGDQKKADEYFAKVTNEGMLMTLWQDF